MIINWLDIGVSFLAHLVVSYMPYHPYVVFLCTMPFVLCFGMLVMFLTFLL